MCLSIVHHRQFIDCCIGSRVDCVTRYHTHGPPLEQDAYRRSPGEIPFDRFSLPMLGSSTYNRGYAKLEIAIPHTVW